MSNIARHRIPLRHGGSSIFWLSQHGASRKLRLKFQPIADDSGEDAWAPYMEGIDCARTVWYAYGVAGPQEIAQLTGKEILQAIIDGRLPQPPISQTLTPGWSRSAMASRH
jgi:hypothetical protein